jgi:hypothetical protein
MTAALRVFSFGGGVQSTAVLVLAAQGRLQYDAMLFCNVGADSENPDTLAYVNAIAKPYAEAHGIDLIEVQRHRRDGTPDTLWEMLHRSVSGRGGVRIPVYVGSGAPGRRDCTGEFKIRVVAKWLKAHGATAALPATLGLGISLDEFQRARTDSGIKWETLEYPLIDLRMTRRDCLRVIAEAGLPQPPKSACFFCPFHRVGDWQRLRHDKPELFAKAVGLEATLNARRSASGRDAIYLHSRLRPLEIATGDQATFGDVDGSEWDACESGYCMV